MNYILKNFRSAPKGITKCLLLFFLCFAEQTHALYNGNPSSPMMPEQGLIFTQSWLSLKGGYEFDDVYHRQWKVHHNNPYAKVKKYTSRAQFGVVTVGCADRVELYSGVGSMNSTFSQHLDDGNKVRYRTDTDFAWSIGGRTIFAYWGDLQFGLAGSYLHFSSPLESISLNGSSVEKKNAELHYYEWQLGAGISYRIGWVYPYVGIDYSMANAKFLHLDSLKSLIPQKEYTLTSQKELGVFLGCGITPERGISLNVEGRFIDETAITITADIRF